MGLDGTYCFHKHRATELLLTVLCLFPSLVAGFNHALVSSLPTPRGAEGVREMMWPTMAAETHQRPRESLARVPSITAAAAPAACAKLAAIGRASSRVSRLVAERRCGSSSKYPALALSRRNPIFCYRGRIGGDVPYECSVGLVPVRRACRHSRIWRFLRHSRENAGRCDLHGECDQKRSVRNSQSATLTSSTDDSDLYDQNNLSSHTACAIIVGTRCWTGDFGP